MIFFFLFEIPTENRHQEKQRPSTPEVCVARVTIRLPSDGGKRMKNIVGVSKFAGGWDEKATTNSSRRPRSFSLWKKDAYKTDPSGLRNRSGSGICKFRSYGETRIDWLQRDYDFRGMPAGASCFTHGIHRVTAPFITEFRNVRVACDRVCVCVCVRVHYTNVKTASTDE